jgi:L-2-hydroxyglutarate oxidase LhgO
VGVTAGGFGLNIDGVAETFDCKTFINAAGLWASDVAGEIRQLNAKYTQCVHLAKGHYFAYQGKSPFNHLVYPVPADGGLGVHATNDMGGSARFGPDVEWVDTVDYAFDESRKGRFVESIKEYFPDLDESKLVPAYTGIRPKLSGPGMPARDFVMQGPSEHGIVGLVNLFGIESPRLTASLAIGSYTMNLSTCGWHNTRLLVQSVRISVFLHRLLSGQALQQRFCSCSIFEVRFRIE